MLTVDSFYENARKGKLLGLRCESGHVSVPPRRSCPTCRSAQLEEVELSGRGEVVSFTRVDYKARDFPLDTPYTL
ncbi:MAG: Zn-ribbon domain-containing OB-fold protein, partial [Nitrososphaerales archaeon]